MHWSDHHLKLEMYPFFYFSTNILQKVSSIPYQFSQYVKTLLASSYVASCYHYILPFHSIII